MLQTIQAVGGIVSMFWNYSSTTLTRFSVIFDNCFSQTFYLLFSEIFKFFFRNLISFSNVSEKKSGGVKIFVTEKVTESAKWRKIGW